MKAALPSLSSSNRMTRRSTLGILAIPSLKALDDLNFS